MPPKVRITKDDIIAAALALVREKGAAELNARAIAAELGCSTQPIFSNFASMEEVKSAVVKECAAVYTSYIQKETASGKWKPYKAFGMAYIRFAKEEKELFRLLFMRDRSMEEPEAESSWNAVLPILEKQLGITEEEAKLVHLEMWVCVHGIASLLVTSFQEFSEELVSELITNVYNGIQMRCEKEKNDGSC